jgi:hypothetical protein
MIVKSESRSQARPENDDKLLQLHDGWVFPIRIVTKQHRKAFNLEARLETKINI